MKIEEIYKALNIELVPAGSRWRAVCPFHSETFPSFVVFEDGGFHCFGCGASGSLQYVMQKLGSEHKFLVQTRDRDNVTFQTISKIHAKYSKKIDKLKDTLSFRDRCLVYDHLDWVYKEAMYALETGNISSLKIIGYVQKNCSKLLKYASE